VIVEECDFWWYSVDGKKHSCHHYEGHTGICECDCGAVPSHGVLLNRAKG